MSNFAQTSFDQEDLFLNPEQRCPCVLLLDRSYSMQGAKIDELNRGLQTFHRDLSSDPVAMKRVEVSIITFGPVQVVQPFATIDRCSFPTLTADESTPMGAAITEGLRMVEERKQVYRSSGISYYRPWVFLITDGEPTDQWQAAAQQLKDAEAKKKLAFFSVGVDGADLATLGQMSTRQPLKLKGVAFPQLFQWLSGSLSAVSRSRSGDNVKLDPPTEWAELTV